MTPRLRAAGYHLPVSWEIRSSSLLGAVAGAVHHAEEFAPGADGFVVLVGHSSGDLVEMRQVVRGPGGEEFRERDYAEGGMASPALEVLRLEIECTQFSEIVRSQARKCVE